MACIRWASSSSRGGHRVRLAGLLLSSLRHKFSLSMAPARFLSQEQCPPNDDHVLDPAQQREYKALRKTALSRVFDSQEPHLHSTTSMFPTATFTPSMTVKMFLQKYESLLPGTKDSQQEVKLMGRITSKREASKKLVFMDMRQDADQGEATTVQLMCSASNFSPRTNAGTTRDGFQHPGYTLVTALRPGDVVGVVGYPARTRTGELSLSTHDVVLLSTCLAAVPAALKNPVLRQSQRYVDLRINPGTEQTFRVRAKVLSTIRRFLDSRGFLEVETPILWSTPGGASARPFSTQSTALGTDLYLRVAPELFLKQCVIGGLERVYEIGKMFRNEDIDTTHHPEFTACEFYQAYASYTDLMTTTEELLKDILDASLGRRTVHVGNNVIDFNAPFARLDVMDELESQLGPLPSTTDPDCAAALLQLCKEHGIEMEEPHSIPRLLDKLIGHIIEPKCIQPTFLMHHPRCMSPLAQSHPELKDRTQRFELIVNARELCNAYTELNDPEEQQRRMEDQVLQRQRGDHDAQAVDLKYCAALEYGLPPTAGWGLGIDRLCMLLTGVTHIRDVLLFPVR